MGHDEEERLVTVLRKNNRAQRSVVKRLRRARLQAQEHADALFNALCETNTTAENVIQEIWERGELNCSPNDYQSIIDLTVEALKSKTRNTESQQFEGNGYVNYGNGFIAQGNIG